ncbi:MAG: ATP-binding cassette domain-containing protein, partial [Planctomycetes bacterium]|nr:ATP-binding cassette domain-containing protein [Planctomycetota bacterium]
MGEPLLRVRSLSKTYNLDKSPELRVSAVREVSFDIHEGEFICVVGESGSGKSTLLHCIGSFEDPDPECREAVQCRRNGEYVSIWRDAGWYRQTFIGVVFQAFHLLTSLRVWQNVELPLKMRRCRLFGPDSSKRKVAVARVLDQLGLADRAQARITEISGGQGQRVAIARALVKGPALILADEPTGNLDAKTTNMIAAELRRLAREGVSVLMVTHNVPVARAYADRIIRLEDGRVVSEEEVPRPEARAQANGDHALKPAMAAPVLAGPERPSARVPVQASPRADERCETLEADAPKVDERCKLSTSEEAHQVQATSLSEGAPEPARSAEQPPPPTMPKRGSDALHQLLGSASQTLARLWRDERPRRVLARLGRVLGTLPKALRVPSCDLRPGHLLGMAVRDARESYASLVTNITAILLGATMSALLLALVFGAKQIMQDVMARIPNIEAVNVWIDYSTGEEPISQAEFNGFRTWPGVTAVVPEIKQLVYLYKDEPADYLACLVATEPGDPEVERLSLVTGNRNVDPEGWDIILTEQVAYEIDHFDPHGLVGKDIIMEMRRYDTLEAPDRAVPSKVLKFPLRVVGVVKFSPANRVYASLNLVRF